MAKYLTGILAILAVGILVVPAQANAETHLPGNLIVHDDAKLFSPGGIDAAKAVLKGTSFDSGLNVNVNTVLHPPESKKAEVDAIKNDHAKWAKFMKSWVETESITSGTKGIYIIICNHPGGIGVISTRETRERGFTDADEQKVDEILTKAFQESFKPEHKDKPESVSIRDAGLKSAAEYIVTKLKDTTVKHTATAGHPAEKQKPATSPLMGYICLGIVGLLGAWLVIGLIRAFRGGGGAGGPGGGGFMTSLFGGLFGAMAGMWLYSNLFGGGGMFGGGSDAFGNDGGGGGGGDGGDTGAGDYSGESGAGGGFDDGGGGGDWGGGGGDFGGGGDW